MIFEYEAMDSDGREAYGTIEVSDTEGTTEAREEAIARIRGSGLFPVKVREYVPKRYWWQSIVEFFKGKLT